MKCRRKKNENPLKKMDLGRINKILYNRVKKTFRKILSEKERKSVGSLSYIFNLWENVPIK